MSERLVPDWQKERGISKGSYRYDFICFELCHYTAKRNQILQLSDVWPGYNKLAPQKTMQKYRSHLSTGEHHEKSWDLLEFISTDTGDCIIHGVMYAPSDGVKWMPKHIALGSNRNLHRATRSTLLVDLLHKAGHIQLQQTNPQVGPLTSARYSLFLKEINGTVVLPDLNLDNFMQFTANKIDIND